MSNENYNMLGNGRASFKCPHMFPTLKSLVGVTCAQDAWEKTYPYTLHELPLETIIMDNGIKHSKAIKSYKAIIRSDETELAVLKNTYTVVQPQTIYNQFAPFIDSGLVELVAGGSLNDGKRISVMAKITGSEREIVKGEEIAAFVNFYAGLDGTLGIGGSIFGVQARCLNGLCALISKFSYSARHTSKVHARLDDAREAIHRTILEFTKSVDVYTQLATRTVSRLAQEKYITTLLTPKVEETEETKPKDPSTQTQNKINRVIELLDTQRGLELVPAVRGTAWQAYSAVTEYLTYEAGTSDETRLNSRMFGESAIVNRHALQNARVM